MRQRGFFAIGICHAKKEVNIGTLFRTAQSYGAAFVFTVGRRYKTQASDTTKAWRHVPLYHYATIDELVESLPYSCPLVGIELDPRAYPIKNYVHPERAVYLLGAEDHGLTNEERDRCHQLIQLPGTYCINVATAGAITMFDRMNKTEGKVA